MLLEISGEITPERMKRCESWTIKKAEHWRLRAPWTARRSNKSILKEISTEYTLEGLMLKLKLQYFGLLMRRTDSGKDPDAGKDWRQEEKGVKEDEIIGWYHWLNGYEFEWAPGTGDGQGGLACYSPWGRKESNMKERLNWTEHSSCYIKEIKMVPHQLFLIVWMSLLPWVSFYK